MSRVSKELSKSNIGGFSLVELMMSLIIIAIGMSIAVLSFQSMITQNRIVTQINDMLLAVNFAISEAPTASRNISIQARSLTAGDACSDGGLSFSTFTLLGGTVDSATRCVDMCVTGQSGHRVFISPIGRAKYYRADDTIEPSCLEGWV